MKTISFVAAVFSTAIVAATVPDENGWYLRRADEMHLEDLPIVDLKVTDDRFGDEIFTGTIETIYKQMKKSKPELFVNEGVVSVDPLKFSKKQTSINCGWYDNDRVPQWNNCIDGLTYLMRLDRAWCGVDAAPACARVSCSHNCGIFLCNKTGGHFRVSCGDIPGDVNSIGNECISAVGTVGGAMDFNTHFIGLRGQRC